MTPQKETDGIDDDLLPEEEELLALAEGLDKEELTMELQDEANKDEEVPEDDDDDSWVEKLNDFSEEERDALKVHIRPVSCVLVKVRLLKLHLRHASVRFGIQGCNKNDYLRLSQWPTEVRTEQRQVVDCEGAGGHIEGMVSSQFVTLTC